MTMTNAVSDIFYRLRARNFPLFVAMLAVCSGIAGCDDQGKDAESASQVAAIVNGEEITVHQINDLLAKRTNVPDQDDVKIKQAVLEQLIDQQIAIQQAMEAKLDRSPKVMRAMEAAKKEVLARAYLEHLIDSAPQRFEWDARNQEEIRKYYNDHPELFEQRRVFTIEEINFVAADDVVAELRQYASGNAGMQEIADWLKARDVKFEAKRGVRAAEQISLNILPVAQTLNQGEIRLFVLGDDRYQVLRVVNSREAPVDEETAAPRIQQFLANQQSTQLLTTEMKRVRQAAEIEYLGEFAASSNNAAATGEAVDSEIQ